VESVATTSSCTSARIAFPVITSFATGIQVGANCSNVDIYKPIITGLMTGALPITDNSVTGATRVTDDNGVTLGVATGGTVNSQSLNILVPNQTSTSMTAETVQYQLASFTTSNCPSGVALCAALSPLGATQGVVGIVVAGAGNSGNAVIAVSGIAKCTFVGAPTAGNYVVAASATNNQGLCKDGGSSPPTTEYLGIALENTGTSKNRVALSIQKQ